MKYSLTSNTKVVFGVKLFQIKAEMSFGSIIKGELGGWIEKEDNLSQNGNAWVYGDAQVYGNAQVSAKASFTKGWFIGGDDSRKVTDITDKTGSDYWKVQYVLGDYEIQEEKKEVESIIIGGISYSKQEVEERLKDLKPLK